MNSRKLAGASAAIGAFAVTAMLLGATTAVAAPEAEHAFALSASGILDIEPISYVEANGDTPVTKELVGLGSAAEDFGISAGVLTAEAKPGYSESTVAKLNIKDLLKAELVKTWCDHGKGGLELVNAELLGKQLKTPTINDKVIDLSPILRVSLGEETRNADDSITVTGIKAELLPGRATGEEELSEEEKAALPAVADLLNLDLAGESTVSGLLGKLQGALPAGVLERTETAQTITVGSATCFDGAADGNTDEDNDGNGNNGGDNGNGNGDDDGDGDGNGNDGNKDRGGEGRDPQVKGASVAPAPTAVLGATVPVTH
ncbi:hypothetical protein [Pseudonocardia sp. TRM90224]|uniref:hypothetical protein n=1 Tax=Pseudonocardia sp. TRM90224 TaxID=2812678 RepID=UPI001E4CF72F|nr:hypothetical protein [Pseudonocardia sp. TRM90224]